MGLPIIIRASILAMSKSVIVLELRKMVTEYIVELQVLISQFE